MLLDAPCGDFNWAAPLADCVSHYIGVDVVPALIAGNRRQHASPRRRFLCRDIVRQRLPACNVILCRDALVHLCTSPTCTGRSTTSAAPAPPTSWRRRSSPIAQTPTSQNGNWQPLNMQKPPFSFPQPLAAIDERCHHSGGHYADKRLALWRLQDLAASPADRKRTLGRFA